MVSSDKRMKFVGSLSQRVSGFLLASLYPFYGRAQTCPLKVTVLSFQARRSPTLNKLIIIRSEVTTGTLGIHTQLSLVPRSGTDSQHLFPFHLNHNQYIFPCTLRSLSNSPLLLALSHYLSRNHSIPFDSYSYSFFSFIVVGPFDITFSAAPGPVGKKPVACDQSRYGATCTPPLRDSLSKVSTGERGKDHSSKEP